MAQSGVASRQSSKIDLPRKKSQSPALSRFDSDLILSETEEAEEEVQAVVKEKRGIVPLLSDLLVEKVKYFYDPSFQDMAWRHFWLRKCLGLIGDKGAIFSLFESLDQGTFS